MRIAFRVDASIQIGTGHVMRCLTLADGLKIQGAECLFICRPHEGHLLGLIMQREHQVLTLPHVTSASFLNDQNLSHADWLGTDWAVDAEETRQLLGGALFDWLVVDHYALDYRWESSLRLNCKRLMVIDDLADRRHNCDLLLDQNLGRDQHDYFGLVPSNAIKLIGPRYALLRPEFAYLRTESLLRRASPRLKELLIAMGGVDKDNLTGKVLDALYNCPLPEDIRITVVLGANTPWLQQVKKQAANMLSRKFVQVLLGVGDVAKVMANSDLAIGAAGGMAWERCSLGLPSLIFILAENQRAGALALQKMGAGIIIDRLEQISEILEPNVDPLDVVLDLSIMSRAAANITDGFGLGRVLAEGFIEHA